MMFSRLRLIPVLSSCRTYGTTPTVISPLETILRTALKSSMKSKTSFRTTVLKSLLADLQTSSHLAGPSPAPEKTLQRAIIARREGAKVFRSATPPREDLATAYLDEASILEEFVVDVSGGEGGMGREELDIMVRTVMQERGIKEGEVKALGSVIQEVMKRAQGRGIGGKEVAEAVQRVKL